MHHRESDRVARGRSTSSLWDWSNDSDIQALAIGLRKSIWCIRETLEPNSKLQFFKYACCRGELWRPEGEERAKRRRFSSGSVRMRFLEDHVHELDASTHADTEDERIVIHWSSGHFEALKLK